MKPNLYLYALDFPDGTVYLGITKNTPAVRWRYHRKLALGGKSRTHLSTAILKCGADHVRIRTLVYGEFDYIRECEVRAISAYRSMEREFGHNTNPGGKALSPEVIAKITAKNRNPSPETLARMSRASASRSPDTIEKMRTSHRGKKASAATRLKMSEASRGRALSPETRAKLSAMKKGKPPPVAATASRTKLTVAQVSEIRRSAEPQRTLAKRYGIGQSQIQRIRANESRRDVPL